jgi:uncharacterized caspase-like protein
LRLASLSLLGFFFFISAGPAGAEKRVALVIGISNYQQVPRLKNPPRDADAVATLFKQAGFDFVDNQRDLRLSDLRQVIREFSQVSRDADISIIYYAGHGIEVDGTNYLVPADAKLLNDFDVEDETVPLERVLRALDPVRRLRLVILDACRDNPFSKTMMRTVASRSIGRGLAKIEPTMSNTLVAFAARAGAVADDGDGANSPFAAALVKYIAEPGLDLRIAFGRVRDEVLKTTGNRQEPFVYGSLGGETLALVPPVPKPADPEVQARIDYELAAQIGTKEAWDSFLESHPTGLYANLARAQNSKLATAQKSKIKDDAAQRTAEADRQQVAEASDKAIAETQRQVEEAKHVGMEDVEKAASLTPRQTSPQEPLPSSPQIDQSDITRLLQAQLRRVGCNAGNIDGNWGDSSEKALELFNKNAKTRFDIKVASLEALDAVRNKPDRVCPLACAKGQRAEGDRCIPIGCANGYFLNSSGSCESHHESAPKPRTAIKGARSQPQSGSSSPCGLDASGHRAGGGNIRRC